MRNAIFVPLVLSLVACEETPPAQQPVGYAAPSPSYAQPGDPIAQSPESSPTSTAAQTAPAPIDPIHPTVSFERALHERVTPRAKNCYERRTQEDPRVGEGVVAMRVIFRAGDGAMSISDMGSTLKDTGTFQCIVGVFESLQWKPGDGKEYDFNVPFDFVKND